MEKDDGLPVDDAVRSSRPRSLTLMEDLERQRPDSAGSSSKGFTLPRTGADSPRLVSTTIASIRPLPKALQPKEIRRDAEQVRHGAEPAAPSTTSVHKVATGPIQLSSGVNVSDSVLRQQRRHSSSSWSPTSPTATSTKAVSLHVSSKPEVVSERPEKDSNVGGRGVVREPNPGLMTLRSVERQLVTRETAKPRRPEVKIPSDSRYKSMSFSDVLSVFQSPSSTTSGAKSPTTPTAPVYSKFNKLTLDEPANAVTPEPVVSSVSVSNAVFDPSPTISRLIKTPVKYSKFNKSSFEVDEPRIIVKAEPTVDSVSVSSAVFDPSPTISRLLKKQQTPAVSTGQRRIETQMSCPAPISAIQIRKSVPSPTTKDENSDGVSTTSTMSDPIELSPNFVDSISSYTPTSPEVEFQVGQDDYHGWSNLPGCSVGAGTKMVEETTNEAADDGNNDDDDDKTTAIFSPDDVLSSVAKDSSPPLPRLPPPRTSLQLNLEEDNDDHDEDRAGEGMTRPRCVHRSTGSNMTEDSGLDCLTPYDSSVDDLEDQQKREVRGLPSSLGSPCAAPTSVNTDSQLDGASLDQSAQHTDSYLQGPTAHSDFSLQDGGKTGSSYTVLGDSRLLDELPAENDRSLNHAQSQTSSSVALHPPAIVDSPAIDELNLLPVCEAEVIKSDVCTSGSIETDHLGSGNDNSREENARNNDDVIKTRVAENNDVRICQVQVVKGALGLGFCIEGGKDSVAGDRPIAVKRLFRAADPTLLGDLQVGDEILSVNEEDFREMSHYEAWNRLKAMPHGTLIITVKRH